MSLRESIRAHLGSRQVSRVLYGAIIGLALVVALENHPPRSVAIIGSLLGTAIAVSLAELYSEIVGTEARTRRHLERAQIAAMWDEVGAVAAGIAFPAIFFLLAALGAFERDTAFTLAKWSGLGLIGAYGFAAARLAGDSVWRALFQACVAALIGGFLIGLKAILH
jgi:hypothetical protein